ncbi:amidase, partial [Oharaeibacter diazotrophicus]
PTGGGSLTRVGAAVAARSAAAVERLEAAGAVVVGKTATVEYAFGGWGTNETLGTPLNPWDTATPLVPGGSSNGSGVAVAAGLVPLALGTDTGGSIRLPASFCGVVGLKTTAGLVDKRGAMTLSTPLDTVGPLARRVADAALALSVLADPERLAGGGPAALVARDGLAALAAGDELAALAAGAVPSPRGLRIGIVENLGVALHPDTAATFRAMLDVLARAGAVLVPVDLGRSMADFAAPCGQLLAVEAYMNFGAFAEEEPNRLGPAVRRRMLDGKRLPAPDFLRTLADRDAARRRVAALFERVDAIVTPTTAHPAIPLAGHDPDASPAVLTRFANFVDLAAVSVSCGLSADGLPIGVQVNVPGFHEIRALAIAAVLEDTAGPFICPLAM